MSSILERRYRRLLYAYPAEYRHGRGDEMIGTLLDLAPPGQRRPSLADAVDLLAGGVRHRLGLTTVPGLAAGLRLAGSLALALAAGTGGYHLLAETGIALKPVGPTWSISDFFATAGDALLGPFPTATPVICVAWMIAALGRAVLPRAASRWLIAIAVLVTGATRPVAIDHGVIPPRLVLVVMFLMFGLIALAGTGHRQSVAERLWAVAGPVFVGAGLIVVSFGFEHGVAPRILIRTVGYGRSFGITAVLVLALVAGLVLVGVVRRWPALRVPADTRAYWAAAILLGPGAALASQPPLQEPDVYYGEYTTYAQFATGLAIGCVLLAGAAWVNRRRPAFAAGPALAAGPAVDTGPAEALPARTTSTERALRLAGLFAVGAATLVCGFDWWFARTTWGQFLSWWPVPRGTTNGGGMIPIWFCGWFQLAYPLWLFAAVAMVALRARVARTALALAIAATLVPAIPDRLDQLTRSPAPGALAVLGVVALVGVSDAARPAWPARLVAFALGAGLAAAVPYAALLPVGADGPGHSISWDYVTGDGNGIGYAVAVPAILGLVVGWQAMRGRLGARWVRGALVLLACGGWLATRVPVTSSDLVFLLLIGLLCVPLGSAIMAARDAADSTGSGPTLA